MSSSTATAAEQINMDTLPPTYLRPRYAYTFSPLTSHLFNTRTISSRINTDVTAPGVETLFTYFVGLATIIELVVAIIAVVRR
jgi:hypothetical protein